MGELRGAIAKLRVGASKAQGCWVQRPHKLWKQAYGKINMLGLSGEHFQNHGKFIQTSSPMVCKASITLFSLRSGALATNKPGEEPCQEAVGIPTILHTASPHASWRLEIVPFLFFPGVRWCSYRCWRSFLGLLVLSHTPPRPICLDADPTVCMPHTLPLCSHFSGKNCKDEYLPEVLVTMKKTEFEPQIFFSSCPFKTMYSANVGAIHQKDMKKKRQLFARRGGQKGSRKNSI